MSETLVVTQRDLVVPVMMDGKPVSTGFQRAYLQSLQLYDLKRIVLFLLQEHLMTRPDMFRRFEECKELDGSSGREILIHTLLHEPAQIIEMAYELVSRVQPEGSFERKKAKAKRDVDALLAKAAKKKKKKKKQEDIDEVTGEGSEPLDPVSKEEAPTAATATDLRQHIAFQQLLPAIREQARADWLAAHPGGSSTVTTAKDEDEFAEAMESKAASAFKIHMEGKLSALDNNPDVYMKWPRIHMPPAHGETANPDKDEAVVGLVSRPVKLCGEQVNHLMSNLSKAQGADFGEFEDERQELGHKRRELCLFDPTLPLDIANIIRLRLDPTFYDKKNPFEENMALANVQYAARRKRDAEQDKKRAEERAARRAKAPRTPKEDHKDHKAKQPQGSAKESKEEATPPKQELVEMNEEGEDAADDGGGGGGGITSTD
jgi:hypothetical protein